MGAFAPIEQEYLLPLVCFGIALPAMVLFAEWRYLTSGDPLFRTLARRWSKIMIALFAVGVATGTILSFEFGLLWPGFMAAFRQRLRAWLRARRLLVLRRDDLDRDLRVRLGPAACPTALPVRHSSSHRRRRRVTVRHLGQRLDEPPDRVRAPERQRRRCAAVVGAGLTVVGDSGWARDIGVTCLFAFAASAFLVSATIPNERR